MNKAILIILDGWGLGPVSKSDAILKANTPVFDDLMSHAPHAQLVTYGEDVGLPHGQMGNSEVGHMNIGAGRTVYQDLLRIDKDIASGSFYENEQLVAMMSEAKSGSGRLHFIGLLSDGGVHSQIDHLLALLDMSQNQGIKDVFVHAFLDGRDTDPHAGKGYVERLLDHTRNSTVSLASMIGRYYAMDRDKRWPRTKRAFDLLTAGEGEKFDDPLTALTARYESGQTDEFIEPVLLDENGLIRDGDTVMFFNFRADRPRQLTTMLAIDPVEEVDSKPLDLRFYSMTPYDTSFEHINVIYDKKPLENTFGQLISSKGLTQLRMAETEKYPHVTYFFSGGREKPFEGERRILVDSPKVATYDLKPSMSAVELTDALLESNEEHQPDFICINFANTDMVGHTGVFEAAVEAAETVDKCVGRILDALLPKGYHALIIADHGNADYMINEDGSPNTAHSKNPVPCIYVDPDRTYEPSLSDGILADVAVTLAFIMGLEKYDDMTGKNLLS